MVMAPPPPLSSAGGARFGFSLQAGDLEPMVTEVLPRYLDAFVQIALQLVSPRPTAAFAVFGSRGGIEAAAIGERFPDASVRGLELSDASVAHASARVRGEFEVLRGLPSNVAEGTHTHAVVVHPMGTRAVRRELLTEMRRVLAPGGQAVMAVPLRGSFPEIVDMMREYALQRDLPKLAEQIEIGTANRPTPETLSDELEAAHLVDVEVDVQLLAVPFESGRAFVGHPIFELMVAHELRAAFELAPAVARDALAYARAAILKYWSEGDFELTVNIGAASGRRPQG